MTRNEAVYAAIREWNAAVTRYWERHRQRILVHRLGQVTCSDDFHTHTAEGLHLTKLPCLNCGAVL